MRGSWTSSLRSCFALGPWLLLSPPPFSFWPLYAWNASPALLRVTMWGQS